MRTCPRCHEEKPGSEFPPDRNICKRCNHKMKTRYWQARNKELKQVKPNVRIQKVLCPFSGNHVDTQGLDRFLRKRAPLAGPPSGG